MSTIPISHRNRPCWVCGETSKPSDPLGVGCMRPWRGRLPRRQRRDQVPTFICEGCLHTAAMSLSGVSDAAALALIHSARKGELFL